MKLSVIAFTKTGTSLGEFLTQALRDAGDEVELTAMRNPGTYTLGDWTKTRFENADALVFIGATGIAVRAIAPFLHGKLFDPAVIVIDEGGHFCISLLSGHAGGANALSIRLARLVGAAPVITTATDLRHLFAVDEWATRRGYYIENPSQIKRVSGSLLDGEYVRLKSDFPILGKTPEGVTTVKEAPYDVWVTLSASAPRDILKLIPPVGVLGIGCKKDTTCEQLAHTVGRMLGENNIFPHGIGKICSIDLKAQEPGLLEFCERLRLPLTTFSAEVLGAVPGEFTASEFVQETTGVDNVCERAVAAAGADVTVQKFAEDGVTAAFGVLPHTLCFEGEAT